MNYPRIWISLTLALHIHQEQTTALGIALALSFFCSLLMMVGKIHFYEGLFYGLLICSPAVMTGVERGNNDLVVFVLLVFASLGLTHGGRRRFISYLLIGLCSVLKIYPAVAFIVAFRERLRVAVAVFSVSAAVLAGYVYVIHKDLLIISSEIPRAISYSYGSQVLFLAVSRVLYLPDPPKVVSFVCVLGVIISVFLFSRRLQRTLSPVGPAYKLMMGTALYISTFSFGNNFNYRMIFLLLIVPDLLRIARNNEEDNHPALLLLALLAVVLWLSPVAFIPLFLLKEALNWVLLASLVFVLLQFLPDAPWTRLQTANGVSDRLA